MRNVVLSILLAVALMAASGFPKAMEASTGYLKCYQESGITPNFKEAPQEITSKQQFAAFEEKQAGVAHIILQSSTLERMWIGEEIIDGKSQPTVWWTETVIMNDLPQEECQMQTLEEPAPAKTDRLNASLG